MKRSFVNLFLFVGILLSVSCSNQYNKIPVVGVTRSVKLSYKPRCIDIDMLMPTKCFMQQNRLVVFEPTTEQMFKVFNPSTMQLLYTFGNVGRADNEFAMQIYNEEITSIDKFEVYSAGKIKTVEFGEGSATISHTKDFPLKAGSQPINRPRKIDDNTYFYDNMSVSNKTCEYVLFDIKTRTETYFSPLQQWCGKELNDVEYNMLYMRDSRYNPYQDKIAVVYHNFPVLKIIDRKSFDERLYRIDVEGFNPTKATGETIYFVEPYVTDNYIYVMWANTSKENAVREETDFTPHIFKFDWSGNMLANYELNYPIVSFTVSEQESKIYGTAIGDKDIRTIYEFEMPQDLTANGRMKHYENKYYAIDIPSTHQLTMEW